MRKLLTVICLLLTGAIAAQDTLRPGPTITVVQPDSAALNAINTYFLQYGLHPDSAKSRELYELVYTWKGTKYQYAGHTLSGVDCSGFANVVYTQCYDTTLPGGCTNIFTMVDTIPKDSLREGDLVFFKIRKGQISHVGVYLGNSCFAHAAVHSGVTVSSLNEAYYKRYYFTGGRLRATKVH
jgi:lipoprotein Spr